MYLYYNTIEYLVLPSFIRITCDLLREYMIVVFIKRD